MFNKLAKVISAATVLAMAVSFAPQSAFAEEDSIGEYSGGANNSSSFSFNLNFSVADANPDNSVGYFPGAFKNFNLAPGRFFTNSQICGNPVCPAGNVKVTKLSTDTSGNVLDLYIDGFKKQVTLAELQGLLSIKSAPGFDATKNEIVKYDVTFGSNSKPELVFFLQSQNSNLINSLSGLSGFTDPIPGLFPRDNSRTGALFSFSLQRVISQRIPEPTAIVGLLGIGFLGTLSLLKRSNMRSFVKNQNGKNFNIES
ncbi:MAG: PEP-CTERM sorting domain-containing protein [Brasilonema octagenarum HA4186-MV1]|jgi:hypothetical protein|nr:PEP-CTERM sorting domain-containing protein [Brasilonema octagenarum HA4186-MV1]